MVLEILADALQRMGHLHARRAQVVRIADAGQLQDVRRLHRAGAQQHLGVGIGRLRLRALADHIVDADDLALLDDDPGGARLDHGGQVGPRQGRVQIGEGGAPAFAVLDGQGVGAEAFLLKAVEIVGVLVARLDAGLDEAGEDRRRIVRLGHMQRAARAVVGVAAAFEGFGPLEVGQDVGIGPAGQAHLAPLVIVAGMAADVDHPIDRRGSAPALAARPPQLAVVQVRFRLRPEAPIVVALGRDQAADAGRHSHQQRVVLAASFQQQDLAVRILGQPIGQHAAGRAGADDDVVEAIHASAPRRHRLSLFGQLWRV